MSTLREELTVAGQLRILSAKEITGFPFNHDSLKSYEPLAAAKVWKG
jgi:hypothetical protein